MPADKRTYLDGHAPVVHEDADNRIRCSSSHRDAENCAVTRKYAKKSGETARLKKNKAVVARNLYCYG
ncbi:hypothetical protein RB195_024448 [Necator americanus]|uniref:Uncharacterized protein n=1 Tax=Necator americanus TaxID=51031 RepID=A0ABR1ENB4_NECAM